MGFKTKGSNNSSGNSNIPWQEYNNYMVEACDLEQPETLTGIVTGIIDLGLQEQEPAKFEFTGDKEAQEAEIQKELSDNEREIWFEELQDYNDGGKVKLYKRFKRKDQQHVALMVDFPDIMVDKGQFFGESNEAPLRMLFGGEFYQSGINKVVVARPISLGQVNKEATGNQWSFSPNHTFYKMAVASKLIKTGEPFKAKNIDQLLGQAYQFKVQVFMNKGKYYTEKCSYVGALARGMATPEIDESLLHIVQFDEENDLKDLKQLRASVKNTMSLASDWEGSKVKVQLEKLGSESKPSKDSEEDSKKTKAAEKPAPKKVEPEYEDEFKDDIPFAPIGLQYNNSLIHII